METGESNSSANGPYLGARQRKAGPPWLDHDVRVTIRARPETKYMGVARYFGTLASDSQNRIAELASDTADWRLLPDDYEPTEVLGAVGELCLRGAITWGIAQDKTARRGGEVQHNFQSTGHLEEVGRKAWPWRIHSDVQRIA